MKLSFIIFLTSLFISIQSIALSNDDVDFNPRSQKTYKNKKLHIYQGNQVDSLQLEGESELHLNGNALLSNSFINNNSIIHMYNKNNTEIGYPVINNTTFNDDSTLTMEPGAISTEQLTIGKNANLRITNIHRDSINEALCTQKLSRSSYIENLNLAGTALIAPTITSQEDDNYYPQQPGPVIVTRIDNLSMQPGSKLSLLRYIPQMQFNQLQINTLSGSGEFYLESHLAAGLSDKIVVNGQASGHFGLMIKDSGHEPVPPKRVDIISVNSGDAQFKLLNNNGVVEVGVWQYTLQHEQNNEHSRWYLSNQQAQNIVADDGNLPEDLNIAPRSLLSVAASSNTANNEALAESLAAPSPTALLPPTDPQHKSNIYSPQPMLSRSAQAVINMARASRTILATEMSTFRQRLGAVRGNQKNVSIWTRYLKDNSHHARHSNAAFQTHLQGLQVGVDKRSEFNAGDWLLGTYISDSKTTVHSGELTQGKIRSQGGGLYTTWLDNSGFYWDNVFKLNQLRHDIRTEMNSGQLTRGHYRQNGISVASEAGYSLHLNPMLTLTPYGKVSYFRTRQVNSVLDNGLVTNIPQATHMDGEAGLMLEVPFNLNHSSLRPYLKAAVSRGLVGNNTLTINGINLDLPGSGIQGKYGLGSILQVADNVSAWAEMDYQKGNKTETPVNATVGLRVSF